jgi:hypothetical protein
MSDFLRKAVFGDLEELESDTAIPCTERSLALELRNDDEPHFISKLMGGAPAAEPMRKASKPGMVLGYTDADGTLHKVDHNGNELKVFGI